MTQTIQMPLWVFVLILLFAVVTFASHFLLPSVRWFFRKRAERVIARVNSRLQRPIEPFKLARRYDMIQRLIYDPEITQAIVEYAEEEGIPENVAFERARHYAREIVPSFSATAYFTIGMRLARFLTHLLYRVRLGAFDRAALEKIDPDATVIFVMNHRSNMDYVLVTHLVSRASTLSYAVGEWARVWPLSSVIKMMGAYFIRRRSRGSLYRKVLARYVRMATDGGVTQAMFPEGGLSLTGQVGEPKLGLLSYIVSGRTEASRDVIFVPVALNYDQVLEDRFLINADKIGKRRFRPSIWSVVRSCAIYAWWRITGRFRGFGTASVGFGTPLELSDYDGRDDVPEAVAQELMDRIKAVVPVLSAPLVARAMVGGARDRQALEAAVTDMLEHLKTMSMPVPRREVGQLVDETLARWKLRKIVKMSEDGKIEVAASGEHVLTYYAKTIEHHFGEGAPTSAGNAALRQT